MAVGLIRVHSLGLERICLDLVAKSDSAPLLAKVENDAAFVLTDELQSSVELLAAIALHAAKYLAGQAFGVYPDRNTLPTGDVSHDQSYVFGTIPAVPKNDQMEGALLGRQVCL